jgi:hypothetical protein
MRYARILSIGLVADRPRSRATKQRDELAAFALFSEGIEPGPGRSVASDDPADVGGVHK